MTDKVAPEKVSLLQAYGAEVVVCPVAVEPDRPAELLLVAERLTNELHAFRPNQYEQPAQPRVARADDRARSSGARPTGGSPTSSPVPARAGSITGIARYLKSMNPAIKIIAADPEGSVFSGGSGRPYLVEGVGEDFFPAAWAPELLDDIIAISDEESFLTARYVSETEGILIGGSGGMAVGGGDQGRQGGRRPTTSSSCSTPTRAAATCRGCSTTPGWRTSGSCKECDQCVGAVLDTRNASIDNLLYVNPHQLVSEAVTIMRTNGISQLPGVQEHAAVRRRRGVGRRRRTRPDGGDPPRSRRDVDTGREGDEPEAADDRRRPEGRAGRRDAGVGAGAAGAVGRAPAERAHPHRRARLLRRDRRRQAVDRAGRRAGRPESGRPGSAHRATASPPARSTPARTPTRPPARSSPRSRCRRRSPRRASAGTRDSSTRAPATRPAPRSKRRSPRSSRRDHGLAFASGLAAEDNILRLLRQGQRTLLGNDAYGGTFRLISKVWSPLGFPWSAVDLTDLDALRADWPDDVGMVWLETPTNPLLTCFDIEAIAAIGHERGAIVVVDNTFATPVPPAAADARRRHRRALVDEVPRRSQRRRRRVRRGRTTTSSPNDCASPRTRPARSRRRSTATSCCAA